MRAVLVLLLVGCAPRAAEGPAWPKQRVAEHDGGESLAPHAAAVAVAGDDADDAVPELAATPVLAAPKVDAPKVDAPKAAPDEPITTEEIVIEVEDN